MGHLIGPRAEKYPLLFPRNGLPVYTSDAVLRQQFGARSIVCRCWEASAHSSRVSGRRMPFTTAAGQRGSTLRTLIPDSVS